MTSEAVQRPATQITFAKIFRILTIAVLGVASALCVAYSAHWRLAVDTPVMHYVVYLMHHGFQPYRDITDSNMPGTYMTETAAMAIFGGSDLAWRIYEFALMGAMIASMIWIARRWDWVAGAFAGGLFLVLHVAEGPQRAAERELVITAFLLVGFAFLFHAVRHKRSWMALIFGLACGVAASIKPTYVVLPAAVLLLAFFVVRRRGGSGWAYLFYGAAGVLAIALADVLFLIAHGAFGAFFHTLIAVVPGYAGAARVSLVGLLDSSLPRAVKVMLLLTIPLVIVNWRRIGRWDWERWALAAGAVFGLWSILIQGKGFVYHRYIFLAFLLLLAGIEILQSLQLKGWPRFLGAGIICMMFVLVVPSHIGMVRAIPDGTSYELTLEGDLQALGGTAQLQHHVECLDIVYGCLNALYHLDLVQASGTTGDLGLYPAHDSPAVESGHKAFIQYLNARPIEVIVLGNELFAEPNSYDKLVRFPQLAELLNQDYTLAVQRDFPHERYSSYYPDPFPPGIWDSYRIYVKKGSPAADRISQLPKSIVALRSRSG